MAADERNFRSYYYEKVGFRGVEEKKSLEILMKDKPLDVIKLKQFSLRFPVPAIHRNRVWKVLLGVYASQYNNTGLNLLFYNSLNAIAFKFIKQILTIAKYSFKCINSIFLIILHLGILPTYVDSHKWVWEQRQMQYNDLTHALEVMGHAETVASPSEKLLLVWLLENRSLHFNYKQQVT